MPETTLRGVSLSTKSRKLNVETFDLGISTLGIEVRRAEGEPRLLGWDRIATWEIEQRRRDVLLTLRGGGSVTPLKVPGWKVDDLDRVLREMTAHLNRTSLLPEDGPDLDLPGSDESESTGPAGGAPGAEPAVEPGLEDGLQLAADAPDPDPRLEGGLDLPPEWSDLDRPEVHLDLPSSPPETPGSADMDLSLPPRPTSEEADERADMDLALPPPAPPPEAAET